MSARHLVGVWNPSYSEDAMDVHVRMLLEWAERARQPDDEADPKADVYVWWGKVRSHNRTGDLPHAAEVLALDAQIQAGIETHLYLTDYRSLYVGQLGEVTARDVLRQEEDPDEKDHIPAYYHDQRTDFWFQLWDLRRIVSDDTPATIAELQKLANTRYHDRPVSLYGGMVELPLVVTRNDDTAWFMGKDALLEGRLWAERDAQNRSESERMARDLRDNIFGQAIWGAMEPATQSFLASAEAVFRARRDDPAFDFSGPAVEYAKAVETELNALIFHALRKAMKGMGPQDREVQIDGRRLDLGGHVSHQSLGAVLHLIEKEDGVGKALRSVLNAADGSWVTGVMPKQLAKVRDMRNAAAHTGSTTADRLQPVRDDLLGVGGEGVLGRVVRARLRHE